MYKVIKAFTDTQDRYHRYNVGDTYPRDGYKPTEARIAALSSGDNLLYTPLIEKLKKAPAKKDEAS